MTTEQEAELRYYRDLLDTCSDLPALVSAVDAIEDTKSDAAVAAWAAFWDVVEEICDFVAVEEHAKAMEAAGIICNDLHHSPVVLSA